MTGFFIRGRDNRAGGKNQKWKAANDVAYIQVIAAFLALYSIKIEGEKLISPVAKQAEQGQKEVDEVQVQGEGAHDPEFTFWDDIHACFFAEILDFLYVIGRKPAEHQHADNANDKAHGAAVQEHIDDAGNDNPYQCHQQ